MKARIHTLIKQKLPDESILSIVIWLLPAKAVGEPRSYKYRLNYSTNDGTTLVRYDNHAGKADHKHIGETETAYEFESIEKLVRDFFADVRMLGRRL